MMSEPIFRISAFSSPTAFESSSLRRELEQTSSAKYSEEWAGVIFSGFISHRRTGIPRLASCQAHSLPARPAPKTVTGSMAYSLSALFFAAVFFVVVFLALVFFAVLFLAEAAFSSAVFFL